MSFYHLILFNSRGMNTPKLKILIPNVVWKKWGHGFEYMGIAISILLESAEGPLYNSCYHARVSL